jgi:ribosome-binding protein aMBF1 (putative translation factor)
LNFRFLFIYEILLPICTTDDQENVKIWPMIITSEENLRTIGLAVKAEREKRNLSIRRLSELMGIDFSCLSRFEAGDKRIGEQNLWALLNYLRIKVREGGVGPESEPKPHLIVCPKCLYRQRIILKNGA